MNYLLKQCLNSKQLQCICWYLMEICGFVFACSSCYSCHILMKLGFSRPVFEKYSNIKFNENPSGENRFVACRRTGTETDGHDGTNSRFFWNFAKTPKKRRLKTVAKYKTRQCGSYNCKKTSSLLRSNQLHSDQKSGYLNEDVFRYCTVCPLNTARECLRILPATLLFV
jgi:hypothetical protein